MAKFTWHNGEVPNGLKVTQVYGLVFTRDGRMLLMAKNRQRFLLSISAIFVTVLMSQPICDAPFVFMMMILPYDSSHLNYMQRQETKK